MKKLVSIAIFVSLILLGSMILAPVFAAPPPIQRPMEIIEATIDGGNPQTIDPAFCYDTASGEMLMNFYDTLVFFNGEQMGQYLPQIADSWAITDINEYDADVDVTWDWQYAFNIHSGIPYHISTYGSVKPSDIEYCIERAMVMDMTGGPTWMFYEPLLNGAMAVYVNGQEYDPEGTMADRILIGKLIDKCVESDDVAMTVTFKLLFPGSYAPFLQILSQTWSSIYPKQWCLDLNAGVYGARNPSNPNWDGVWGDYTGWWAYHDPPVPPLDDPSGVACGAGPYTLESWDNVVQLQWTGNRFVNYWRGWPANWPTYAGASPKGYVNHVVVSWAWDWNARSTKFLNGEVDYCAVPRQYIGTVLGTDGIRCIFPLPSMGVDALFYNFQINPTSPYGTILADDVFDENGIPANFFGYVDIRKAFSQLFDFNTFLATIYLGEAMQPPTAIIPGLKYYDASIPKYTFNIAAAKTLLQGVAGGALWTNGFSIALCYNQGNLARQAMADLLKAAIESPEMGNAKFHATVINAPWASYLYARDHGQLTCFSLGWLADYPDEHNFAYAFYYSYGNFPWRQAYANPAMDALIDQGIRTPDGPARQAIYSDIQQLVIDDCPSVAIDQAIGRHFERDWITGWYYNPIYSGNYYYNTWKWYYVPQALLDTASQPTSSYLGFDVNYNGQVNMLDIGTTAASFGAIFGPPMSIRWIFRCDYDNNRQINMKDIGFVAKNFGKSSAAWTPTP